LLAENPELINAKDGAEGWTPLHWAARNGHRDVVQFFIVKEAGVNARDGEGQTPLSYAQEQGYTEIVELLRKHGAE
jgi:ankyrin repeat protein